MYDFLEMDEVLTLMIGISGVSFVMSIVSIIIVIILSVKLSGMRKRYHQLMSGIDAGNVEQLLIQLQNRVASQQAEIEKIGRNFGKIQERLNKMKSKLGVIRYKAFADQGSDLSFSIAIMDEEQNGVVLTGLHGRNESYLFAKPVEQGHSKYTLTPEEKEAIHRSLSSD